MKKIPKVVLLYIINLATFIVLFGSNFFDSFIFVNVSFSIAQLPLPEIFRTIILMFWMIVPQSMALAAANYFYFRLTPKKFLLTQSIFAVSIAFLLLITFILFK